MSVVAIIPALNEEKTIAEVVTTLRQSQLIDEVIVVSDGSTDATSLRAREAGARVLDLPVNRGKGASILYGLTKTDASILLFVDADLYGFSKEHVIQLLRPVLDGERAMNIGLRDRGIFTALTAHLPLVSGERALRRQVIEAIPAALMEGYMIESALNYSCRSRKLAYGSVPLRGLTIRRKYNKVGWPRALWQYARMSLQILKGMILVRFHKHFGMVWK